MVEQRTVRIFVAAAGPLVLLSYVLGIARADDAEALWGGIEGTARTLTIPWMFVAAAGFLAYAYVALWNMDEEAMQAMAWPWATPDGTGGRRLLVSYALYLIPSMLWLEATLLHLQHGAAWSQAVVIVVLALVVVGLVMMGLLGWRAWRHGVPGGGVLVLGAVGMGIQSLINDLILWVAAFPW